MQLGEDFFDGAIEAIHGNWAFFAGLDESAQEFFPVEGLTGAIAFHHAQLGALDLFVGGVAIRALQACAAATDRGTVF